MPYPIGRTQTGAYANVERGNQRGIKEVARLRAENANLRGLVKRLTDVAEDLSSCTADPGSEALAAIYCGRNLIYG